VQGSKWLELQVALLHTWVGEDQCRVNPLQSTTSPISIEPLLLLLPSSPPPPPQQQQQQK